MDAWLDQANRSRSRFIFVGLRLLGNQWTLFVCSALSSPYVDAWVNQANLLRVKCVVGSRFKYSSKRAKSYGNYAKQGRDHDFGSDLGPYRGNSKSPI